MVKKRQTDAQQDGSSWTDSGEEEMVNGHAAAGSNATSCQHIKKAVDPTRLRRHLKSTGLLYDCQMCLKLKPPNESGNESAACEYDNTLWLCLKCGSQLCSRERNKHALLHYQTPHSDSHALALNTRSFKIWCYDCGSEVSANSRKNLLDCVELVKRLAQKPLATVADVYKILSTLDQVNPIVPMTGGKEISATAGGNPAIPMPPPTPPSPPPSASLTGSVPGMAKRVLDKRAVYQTATGVPPTLSVGNPELDRLPRVRGLTNLGNTCFFNAVMQCLAQTPFLLDVLKELAEPGEQFVLPGGTFNFKDKGDVELPMIKGTLSSWGNLTSALANALEELQSGGSVFTPSKLFDKLCAKCPQFTGGDQHDAHELLRQLLESVRSEDLKRYQRVILQNLGYKDQDISSVSEELRQKCKIYGNQAADRILRPEQVFRGFLVSTLTCQDCFNISSRHEYFLDISLPVAVEKPQPPQRRRTSPENSPSSANQSNSVNPKLSNGESEVGVSSPPFYLHTDGPETLGPSKAQVKKEKERERKAKRAAKHQRTKQAQRLSLKLNISNEANGGGGGGDDVDGEQQPGSVNSQGQGQPTSADTDSEKTRSAPWGEGSRAKSTSQSATSSEHSDADVEDNLVDDAAGGSNAKFYTDSNGNSQPAGEKRDDTPEHMDKDSLEEDENDSGIATSPAPTTSTNSAASTTSTASNGNNNNNEANSGNDASAPADGVAACLVNASLSEKGASQIRQLSSGQLQLKMEQLKLQEQAKNAATLRRVRTQSYSDWSTTIAPRYQCEVGECSVASCLNNFTAVELMTGQNKVGCESCTRRINGSDPQAKTVNTNATKQLLVSSPPAVLILHLKRFQLGPRCIFRKLTRPVSYTVMLDIAAFCGSKVKNLPNIDRKQKKLLYALYGVVEHSGGLYGGHYTAYVKVRPKVTPDDKRWKFLPHGSKAELDQGDELKELLAKEKAREMRMNALDDSDDFTSSSSNASTTDDSTSESVDDAAAAPAPAAAADGSSDQPAGMANGEEEAANVKAPPGKWYYVSDSRVQEVSEEAALNAQAYLLFYERIY
ncbi:ubiquitin carboxyl-terminal hydrolase 45 [Drosophila navojoa]|nr:ubiquitin carboxyl-terminal hydrolase 45 [Drosophila navojoa]